MKQNSGIGFIGSLIVDTVSEVLEPGNLVYSDGDRYLRGDDFESETVEFGTGGLALNDSVNCARIGATYPLVVLGKIGADDNGRRIREFLESHGITSQHLVQTADHPTSTTQVLYVRDSNGTINRTFRHYFGAMGDFGPKDIDWDVLGSMKMVMIGYCLLMPLLDAPDDEHGAVVGQILRCLKEMGVMTGIDFVTPKHHKWWKFDRFRTALQWVDILSIGEDQAEGLTGIADEVTAAKALVHEYGVNRAIVHCGDKGNNYMYSDRTGLIVQRIYDVPPDEWVGNTGAGDAFTSGLLHGLYQEWDDAESLKFATASAAVSLGSLTCTDAMRDEAYIREYMATRPLKSTK